jgi:hypothetical protein
MGVQGTYQQTGGSRPAGQDWEDAFRVDMDLPEEDVPLGLLSPGRQSHSDAT